MIDKFISFPGENETHLINLMLILFLDSGNVWKWAVLPSFPGDMLLPCWAMMFLWLLVCNKEDFVGLRRHTAEEKDTQLLNFAGPSGRTV